MRQMQTDIKVVVITSGHITITILSSKCTKIPQRKPRYHFVEQETERFREVKGSEKLKNLLDITELQVPECELHLGHQSFKASAHELLDSIAFCVS